MLTNNNYKTAIKRGGPSAPVKWVEKRFRDLEDNPEFTIRQASREREIRVLDYGCGRGEDAEYMGADRYDPYWFPPEPTGEYDIIFCTYVLNVLEREERSRVLDKLEDYAAVGCVRYVTVRRDISIINPLERDGYKQWYVLNGDMFNKGYRSVYHRKNNFEIYVKSDYGDY